jgi:phage replication-related protein YjqB (UPF0714/DUF867 family)
MDEYATYDDLKHHEREGEDYVILFREGNSGIAIFAPHGGGIEPGTVDIADAVAGSEHTFYAFKGIKRKGNADLHIKSNSFDKPIALQTAKKTDIVVSIHGYHGKDDVVLIGGRNQRLEEKIRQRLDKAGIHAEISKKPGLRAQHPENICNRCRSGQGVQLEISRGLREKMFSSLGARSLRKKTAMFYMFADTLKSALFPLGPRKPNISTFLTFSDIPFTTGLL